MMPAETSRAMEVDEVAGSSHAHDVMAAGCSCLPFCFWGSSRVPAAPERRPRRRRRLRLSLSWFSWPWRNRKSRGGKGKEAGGEKKKRKKLLRLRLMLLTTSSQAKKAFATVSSRSIFLPKLQVSNFGAAKKQNRGRSRRTVEDEPTTSCAQEAAPARRPETISQQPCPRPSGAAWRAPSSRLQPALWAMATTLGAIIFFGRVTAVFFLCSCMYGARWWFGTAAQGVGIGGGSRRLSDAGVGGSWRLGDRVAADLCTEEYKRKVVMDGLLERAGGKRPSVSRFCK